MTRSDITLVEPIFLENQDLLTGDMLNLLAAKGLAVRSDCGGLGLCGKCRVLVHSPENVSGITNTERKLLSVSDLDSGLRLACQAKVTGKVQVSVSKEVSDSLECLGKTDLHGNFTVDPAVVRIPVPAGPTSADKSWDVITSLKSKLMHPDEVRFSDSSVLADLSFLWDQCSSLTLVNYRGKGITRIMRGDRLANLGFAVDIGTTTIAGYLCDLRNGTILAAAGCANPQRRFGEDVVSRIAYSSQNGGVNILKGLVTAELNRLIWECLKNTDLDSSDVDEVVVVGNTTMQHLFCGVNPQSLGRSPYRPVTRSSTDWKASDLRIDVHSSTNIHVFPVISGFVGGDAVSAVISQSIDLDRDQVSMIVDIGTNGEVVISSDGQLWATSCATGPALEGAHVSSGMRAVTGAIDRMRINPIDFTVTYNVLGHEKGARPKGICGSGIIDAVSEMRKAGLILPNGRLNESLPCIESDSGGVGRSFTLVQADATVNGQPILITLKDIRQIQLAKAALAGGINLLMNAAGVDHIDLLILTGAFGARFDWKNAASIGMLPASCVSGRVEIVQNAAGLGAVAALLDWNYRRRASIVSEKTVILELSEHPQFLEEFNSALDFPALPSEMS